MIRAQVAQNLHVVCLELSGCPGTPRRAGLSVQAEPRASSGWPSPAWGELCEAGGSRTVICQRLWLVKDPSVLLPEEIN